MPKILVCYKWVLDEQDIKIAADTHKLDTGRAKYVISEYDKNAIEEATLMLENQGANVDVVTFGTAAVKQSLKDVLSRGPERAFYIADDIAQTADAYVTANVLAAFARKNDPYDLIICGEGSSDEYNQQVAPRIGALLGVPALTYASKITLDGNSVSVTRKLDDCVETVAATFPAVISVLPEVNKARIPSLKQVLAAAKKPSEEVKVADLGLSADATAPKVRKVDVKGYVMSRKNNVYKDSDQQANVKKLIADLASEGLV